MNFIIKTFGKNFLANPQYIENRNYLRNAEDTRPDAGITLPETPVIWVANHVFKDDALATLLAMKRHAYFFFGSLPQFYNTFDGITSYLNGVIMLNRKVKGSRKASLDKAIKIIEYGADLMVFPEGGLNKSPNLLLTDLWPGIYRIACETGAQIVPVTHYIRDCCHKGEYNPIHTVIDDPIRIDDLSEKAALVYIRDVLATWLYLMMDVWGKTTRQAMLEGEESTIKAWEKELTARVQTLDKYDKDIELCTDYRPHNIVRPEVVWKNLANIEKITSKNSPYVAYAQNLMDELKKQDFQRRF